MISPRAMPPSVVFTTSFSDGGLFSPKYSQSGLPAAVKGTALQKPYPLPLARPKWVAPPARSAPAEAHVGRGTHREPALRQSFAGRGPNRPGDPEVRYHGMARLEQDVCGLMSR